MRPGDYGISFRRSQGCSGHAPRNTEIPTGTAHWTARASDDGRSDAWPRDTDSDGDGLVDVEESGRDLDLDGIPNHKDRDSDGDGMDDALDPNTYCADARRNFRETDVDCGGPGCAKCADGARCAGGSDCRSLVCNDAIGACAPSACGDGVRNGDEAAIDCGGSCEPCVLRFSIETSTTVAFTATIAPTLTSGPEWVFANESDTITRTGSRVRVSFAEAGVRPSISPLSIAQRGDRVPCE